MAVVTTFVICSCAGQSNAAATTMTEASYSPYKIAMLTCTDSQGEEEYSTASSLAEQYPDIVIHDTYPDSYSDDTDAIVIEKLLAFAENPDVKAIILVQGVQGAVSMHIPGGVLTDFSGKLH